jgi:hypothetical protein
VSFSEPGRDDSSLPPVNVVIPDDARELDRDVLAYRREVRARRRRQRLLRLLRPFHAGEFGGHAAIIPLIAACLAISLVGGALLSVVTMSPASAPQLATAQPPVQPPSSASTGSATTGSATTVPTAPAAEPGAVPAAGLGELPAGIVTVAGHPAPLRSLVPAAIALVPANCDCGAALSRFAAQAVAARVNLYFAGTGAAIPQLPTLAARYGDGAAVTVADDAGVLAARYHPADLTALLVSSDATAADIHNLHGDFQLTSALAELTPRSATPSASTPQS